MFHVGHDGYHSDISKPIILESSSFEIHFLWPSTTSPVKIEMLLPVPRKYMESDDAVPSSPEA